MSPGSILSPTCILIPSLCQWQRIVTCVRETPSVCLRHGSHSVTRPLQSTVYVHIDCVQYFYRPNLTTNVWKSNTLNFALRNVNSGWSLSWRCFHTGTRRNFLEYTDAVISIWIRQNSPKDRKDIYTPKANLVQTESIWTWGSLSTLYYKVWKVQHSRLAPKINISQSILHRIMV